MTSALELVGLNYDNFSCSQLILVSAIGPEAEIVCYGKDGEGLWLQDSSYTGWVGLNGVTMNKQEGDKSTPAGLYKLGFAFGIREKPIIELEYRQVTKNDYWVDDLDSEYYNQWVGVQRKRIGKAQKILLINPGSLYMYP